uniref:Uncharacterized protein n=1 Tax=Trichuris muris TaxID=70415 RepID=A0A5S6QZ59_TRIMR
MTPQQPFVALLRLEAVKAIPTIQRRAHTSAGKVEFGEHFAELAPAGALRFIEFDRVNKRPATNDEGPPSTKRFGERSRRPQCSCVKLSRPPVDCLRLAIGSYELAPIGPCSRARFPQNNSFRPAKAVRSGDRQLHDQKKLFEIRACQTSPEWRERRARFNRSAKLRPGRA